MLQQSDILRNAPLGVRLSSGIRVRMTFVGRPLWVGESSFVLLDHLWPLKVHMGAFVEGTCAFWRPQCRGPCPPEQWPGCSSSPAHHDGLTPAPAHMQRTCFHSCTKNSDNSVKRIRRSHRDSCMSAARTKKSRRLGINIFPPILTSMCGDGNKHGHIAISGRKTDQAKHSRDHVLCRPQMIDAASRVS